MSSSMSWSCWLSGTGGDSMILTTRRAPGLRPASESTSITTSVITASHSNGDFWCTGIHKHVNNIIYTRAEFWIRITQKVYCQYLHYYTGRIHSGKYKATVWSLLVRLSVCLSVCHMFSVCMRLQTAAIGCFIAIPFICFVPSVRGLTYVLLI